MDFKELIKKICEEEKLNYRLISDDWCFVIEKEEITKYIIGRSFSLNDQAVSNIIDDKYALYELCKLYNIPIIEYRILFNPQREEGSNSLDFASKYFQEFNNNVVIKPNIGSEGNNVYHITKKEDLDYYLNQLFLSNYAVCICPYYDIKNEYRLVVLDDSVKLIFKKERLVVIGDGIKSKKELLRLKNPVYFQDIFLDNSYDEILPKDEKFIYDWHFNLSKGATATLDINEGLKNKLANIALKATSKIGARFVTVDIIDCNNKLSIMEINSKVCINKVCNFIDKDYKIAKKIYKEAIFKMFEDNNEII